MDITPIIALLAVGIFSQVVSVSQAPMSVPLKAPPGAEGDGPYSS